VSQGQMCRNGREEGIRKTAVAKEEARHRSIGAVSSDSVGGMGNARACIASTLSASPGNG